MGNTGYPDNILVGSQLFTLTPLGLILIISCVRELEQLIPRVRSNPIAVHSVRKFISSTRLAVPPS